MAKRNPAHHIPERFLRQLWKHQQFQTSGLKTTDGKEVEVFSPGIFNRDGGPDFTDAAVRIGGTLYRGDVELHQYAQEWEEHQHDGDPKYNSVILHVVLYSANTSELPATESRRTVPVLILNKYLYPAFHTTWQGMINNERSERMETIKCSSLNDDVDASVIKKWLNKLAVERIELKVRRFEERLKELVDQQQPVVKEPPPKYGELPFGINPEDLPPPTRAYSQRDFANSHLWEQLLYEGVMESLGYSKNQQPFLRLAQNLTLQYLDEILRTRTADAEKHLVVESLLFNVSGLLPLLKDISDKESETRVRQLRSKWKLLQKLYHKEFLSSADWQFFRLRPENFPTVRLAGAGRLIVKFHEEDVLKSFIRIVKNQAQASKQKFSALEELFITPADEFWSQHVRFEERSKSTAHTIVGKSRADDIVLNVIIPICLLYARIFKDKDVRQGTLRIFEQCPPLSDNTTLQMMRRQLIKEKCTLNSAMLQQGAIQLYKSYCTPIRCAECTIGKIVFSSPSDAR